MSETSYIYERREYILWKVGHNSHWLMVCTRIYTIVYTHEMPELFSFFYFRTNVHHLWYNGETYNIFIIMEKWNMVATLHTSFMFLYARSSFLTFMGASWTIGMLEYLATLQKPFSWRVIKSKATSFNCITPTSVTSTMIQSWCSLILFLICLISFVNLDRPHLIAIQDPMVRLLSFILVEVYLQWQYILPIEITCTA
jgi:hypothetical protein